MAFAPPAGGRRFLVHLALGALALSGTPPIPGLGGIASPAPVTRAALRGNAGVAGGAARGAAGSDLRWNQSALASLLAYAQDQWSSAVIVVHHGEVIAERYWSVDAREGSPYANQLRGRTEAGAPVEDVASMQKSIVSVLVGIAVDEGQLDLEASVSTYLRGGWSNATCDEESLITVRHLLSMTSGLSPALEYQAPAGTVWLYNTRAYSKVVDVLEAVTGDPIARLTKRWLTEPMGMENTEWRPRPWVTPGMDANPLGLFTTARDLVRFGELMLARGSWNGRQLVSRSFVDAAVKSSQSLNPSYGLLWWLNGRPSSRGPGAAGNAVLAPAAPGDLYAAQGALGRKLYVVPSLDLVVVRLGDAPGEPFNQRFWELLMAAAPASSGPPKPPTPPTPTFSPATRRR